MYKHTTGLHTCQTLSLLASHNLHKEDHMTENLRPLDKIRAKATVSIPEAAEALSISLATAYRWAREGTLPGAFRAGPGAVRVRTADLLALLAPHE